MNKTFTNVLIFATGAVIGSLVTWKVVKTKYERIAQEEIDSVKEMWAQRNREKSTEVENDIPATDDDEDDDEWSQQVIAEYDALVTKYNTSSSDDTVKEGGYGDLGFPYIEPPYVIHPNDFGDGNYGYSCYCLTYYADGVLADDWWVKMDIDETIGEDALEHFGDYTEDVVHVRNERNESDYEVTRDPRRYDEALRKGPLMNMYED